MDTRVIEARHTEFADLFAEFARVYLTSKEALTRFQAYRATRQQARENFKEIEATVARGEEVTAAVLAKLLPYADTAANREAARWTHVAPAFISDARAQYEAAGWAQPDDWPQVAQAVFDFVRRCTADPTALPDACADFAALSYTKGFQAGTLSPILNALRPKDFILINRDARRVINYFAGTAYTANLSDYADLNATALALVDAVADVLHAHRPHKARPSDLFDMFCHWLVSERHYPFDAPSVLNHNTFTGPLNEIFASREEAEWALDMIHATLTHLGIQGAEDARFALTLRDDGRALNLVFGKWTILRFIGPCYIQFRVGIALLEAPLDIVGPYDQEAPFATEDATKVRIYLLPMDSVNPMPASLQKAHARTLDDILARFGDWDATHVRRYHDTAIADAIFDAEKRDALFESDFCQETSAMKDKKLPYRTAQRNFWWVNQGATLDIEKQGGYLWAPLTSKSGRSFYHWDLLTEMQAGDIVLHHENGALCYVSQVRAPASIAENPHTHTSDNNWEKQGRLVRVDYHKLEPPVPVSRFAEDVLNLAIDQGPLNRRGQSKQGYAFRLTEQALTHIYKASPESTWPGYIKSPTTVQMPPRAMPYPLSDLAADTYLDTATLTRWVRAIERKGQAVLYGPPGTGKTFLAEKLAQHLVGDGDGFWELVQFHPAYAYEDFIQGIRPQTRDDGTLAYPMVPGRFLDFCTRASQRSGRCVLIIDEVNRANLARVFGELMYLLEYRDRDIPLAGGGTLHLPANIRILGTMNTADRSIALVDHALRRRFAFIALHPNYDVLRRYHAYTGFDVAPLIALLQRINGQIGDPHYALGITYFLHPDLGDHLEDIWRMEIEPYLEEYFFDQPERATAFTWDKVCSTLK